MKPGRKTPEGVPLAWLKAHKNFTGTDCLPWPFWRSGDGRGLVRFNGKATVGAYRVMCEHRHGLPPTPKHQAAHNCGKGHLGCVNPQHLDWKTPKENMADTLVHGTHNRGTRHYLSKLTEADVLSIRAARDTPRKQLAQKYGVHVQTISAVLRKQNWAWL